MQVALVCLLIEFVNKMLQGKKIIYCTYRPGQFILIAPIYLLEELHHRSWLISLIYNTSIGRYSEIIFTMDYESQPFLLAIERVKNI